MCARLRAMVEHRRQILPTGLRWRWRRERSSVRGEAERHCSREKWEARGEAELRWLENGEARLLAGATGRHPAGVAGMRSPCDAACLMRSDAYARGGRRKPAREVGWAEAKARARGGLLGRLRLVGQK